jgi:hypothetical protein
MNIIRQFPLNRARLEEHDRLIRRYLAEHEHEWNSLTGVRRLIARIRAEFRARRLARKYYAGRL